MTGQAEATGGGEIRTLHEGTRVLVRPLRPEDRDELRRGFDRLSPESRYQRFHASVTRLSDRDLDYLTQIDQRDHVAWVAFDIDLPDQPGVGVGRYVRLKDEPDVAEAALTVVDSHHGRGLGTVLLGFLERSALANDIRAFRTYVLATNRPMLQLLEELGAQRGVIESGVVAVDVPVLDPDQPGPATPAARVVKEIASGRIPDPTGPIPVTWQISDARPDRPPGQDQAP